MIFKGLWIYFGHVWVTIYHLVMTNIAMENPNHGPNRNRWFTVLNSMVDLSMANWQCHNQRVVPFKATKHCHGTSPIYFDVQGFPRRGFPMLTIFTYQRFLEISISTLTIKFWASYHVKITTFYPSFPSHELSR